jgi:hypothetical protein
VSLGLTPPHSHGLSRAGPVDQRQAVNGVTRSGWGASWEDIGWHWVALVCLSRAELRRWGSRNAIGRSGEVGEADPRF